MSRGLYWKNIKMSERGQDGNGKSSEFNNRRSRTPQTTRHFQLSPAKCSNAEVIYGVKTSGEKCIIIQILLHTDKHIKVQINTAVGRRSVGQSVSVNLCVCVCVCVCSLKRGSYAEGKVVMRSCPSGGLILARAWVSQYSCPSTKK